MFKYYEIHNAEIEVQHRNMLLSYNNHMHNDFEFFYVLNGTQNLKVMDKKYTMSKGDCAVIFPNVVHSYEYDENCTPCEHILIFVSSALGYSIFPNTKNIHNSDCIVKKENIGENAVLAFDKILTEASINAQIGWAYIILSYLIPEIMSRDISHSSNSELTSKILSYVSLNYKKSLTLDMISDELKISKFTISRIFSSDIRISFREYIGMLRTNHAAQLINTSDKSFEDIAEESGFESLRSFYRIFKNVYNITPARYRKMIRENLTVK